uniref:FAM20 C-terminal domain-containing protein n=1 Tax=Meloidogyne javanica TaxID=6303 RepID=A0A915M5S8_MELJA
MASRHGPENNEIGLEDQDEMLIAEYKARQDWRKFRPADQQQNHNLIENRPGEQLSFQPQVPPNMNSKSVRFSDLNIVRSVDKVLASKIQNYMVQLPHKLDEGGCMKNTTLAKYWLETHRRVVPVEDSWERFYAGISSCELYNDDRLMDKLLSDMSKLRIKHTAIMEGGTQVKLVLTFENDKQAVFKPMRFGRDYETDPNHFYFGDFERHNAEIATFHLDKILGYRRAVPTVGRVVNMTSELMEVAERRLRKTFFISPADWQEDMDYCERKVKHMRQYAHGRRLLDLIDLHLMDYLIGNQDRHHYETFDVFGDIPAYAIHLDNGRSFGKTNFDDADILMPLRQCCLIKPKTLSTLFGYYTADKGLSETLHESLSKDPAFPILAFKHYTALERRLHKMMVYILECMDKQSDITNMVRNEFHNPSVPAPIPGENLESEDEDEDDTANQQNEVQPNQKQPAPPEQQQPDDKEEENARNVLKPPLRQKKDEGNDVQMPAIIQPPPAA